MLHVLYLDTGYTFGEYAMFDENNMRKASVVATTETLLVVIPKEIYNQSLKVRNRYDKNTGLRFKFVLLIYLILTHHN